ncbi:ETC complex I subunit [Luteithermobacter gelatinilyticus]|uniref:ETC complex I subunit n=1 Tax=Luteithermobacter gelatinilyticus TaxID=2582913 RepID=UPI001105D04C|nr:ETC complex I subunit [Luteithermobacter gelatinilyticus]
MTARIYQPARNAMQSGKKGTGMWVLEFDPEQHRYHDPLMGWTGSGDVKSQIQLKFDTMEDAVAYAKRYNIDYVLLPPHRPKPRIKSYADSFAYRG